MLEAFFSPDIIPNLVLAVLPLLGWLLARSFRLEAGRFGPGLQRGLGYTSVVTGVGALPALALSWSAGGRHLGMMAMLTWLLAFGSAVFGLVAFLVGLFSGNKASGAPSPPEPR